MLIEIIPPVGNGGVHDFACKLQSAIGQESVRILSLSKENSAEWKVDSGDTFLLHFSGYGFEKRGVPLWLVREIEKRRKNIKTLGVYFHELYAFGPPWSSSFWLSPVQRHITRRLAELSDFWMTSREGGGDWLRRFATDKPHGIFPVFSTIGEPVAFPKERLPKIVVFGSPGLRRAAYKAAGDRLFSWARQAALEVHDIGAPIVDSRVAATFRANNVIQHGRLDDHAVSLLMKDALFGLLAYPVDYVAKSSVFAAYCAHGICPVLISASYAQADNLRSGIHYLPEIPDGQTMWSVTNVADAALAWYQTHGLACHSRKLFDLLGSV